MLSPDDINVPRAEASDVLASALTTTYFIAGIIAVIVLIVGGIMYATAAGDPNGVAKARNLILFSIIGLVVVVIAYAVTLFVQGAFQ